MVVFFAKAQPESLKVPWRCFGNKILNTCAVGLDPNKQAPMRSDCGEPTEKALSSEIFVGFMFLFFSMLQQRI